MATKQRGGTTVIRMADKDRKLSKAIAALAKALNTKTSTLVAIAVLKEYGPLLKLMGLYDPESVIQARREEKE